MFFLHYLLANALKMSALQMDDCKFIENRFIFTRTRREEGHYIVNCIYKLALLVYQALKRHELKSSLCEH